MKVVSHVVAFALGMMLMAIWLLGNAPDMPPAADACVPLYDQLPNEHWSPSPECPAPATQKGE